MSGRLFIWSIFKFVLGAGDAVLFLAYPFIIAKRIRNEEEVPEKGPKGYSDYQNKVRYGLISFVWLKHDIFRPLINSLIFAGNAV